MAPKPGATARGRSIRMSVRGRLKAWAWGLKRDVVALWIAARDPRTPGVAKLAAALVAAYALSPVDLIPDFVPILGYLDDLILVPLGVALVLRMIPAGLMAEFRAEAIAREGRPRSLAAAIVILMLWLAAAVGLGLLVWRSWVAN